MEFQKEYTIIIPTYTREKKCEKKRRLREKENQETFKQDPVKFQKYFIYTYFYVNL